MAKSCGVGRRRGSDLVLLWLWCSRLAAVAPIRPLAWEPPCAATAALKRQKDQKKPTNSTMSKCLSKYNQCFINKTVSKENHGLGKWTCGCLMGEEGVGGIGSLGLSDTTENRFTRRSC